MRRLHFLALLGALVLEPSCVVVGYSNRGGWFLWPGGLGLLVVVAILFLLSRRRGR